MAKGATTTTMTGGSNQPKRTIASKTATPRAARTATPINTRKRTPIKKGNGGR